MGNTFLTEEDVIRYLENPVKDWIFLRTSTSGAYVVHRGVRLEEEPTEDEIAPEWDELL